MQKSSKILKIYEKCFKPIDQLKLYRLLIHQGVLKRALRLSIFKDGKAWKMQSCNSQ